MSQYRSFSTNSIDNLCTYAILVLPLGGIGGKVAHRWTELDYQLRLYRLMGIPAICVPALLPLPPKPRLVMRVFLFVVGINGSARRTLGGYCGEASKPHAWGEGLERRSLESLTSAT
jgi:hypothetical protein